ncbi:TetR/AcrR family transcriptional regulator [Pseudoduganella sp. OTU4001]|uniref:TetR/AcrR family transcriptional regulator n=1 Tax=Pseudoduganella sp. OTU4001 TaxID=3043854 RepID=UPI00313BFD7D
MNEKKAISRRREALTPERIELAALELIDQVGLEAFSMRKLGEKLGCEAMSIYHHFPNKEHLLDALVDRLVASVEVPPRALASADRLRGLARGWRAMSLRHPRFFPVLSVHRLNSAVCVHFLNEIMLALRDAGLEREIAARTFRALAYFLVGAALDEISGYAKGPSSLHPVSGEELARQFPDLAAAGEYFVPEHFERTFEYGLELLLRPILN